MTILSSGLPPHKCYQRANGNWICSGGDQRGYGNTSYEAYHDWIYLIRYNSDGRNW